MRHKTVNLRNVNFVWAVPGFCVAGGRGLASPLLRHNTTVLRRAAGEGLTADSIRCATQQTMSAVRHSRHCPLCHTTDNICCVTTDSICCVTQQTMSAMRHSRHCLLCGTADIVCCVAQQTLSAVSYSRQRLLCDTAEMSAVSHGIQCLLYRTA